MFISVNPATNQTIQQFELLSDPQLSSKLQRATSAYHVWSRTGIEERILVINRLCEQLEEREEEIARAITIEMGKPINQSIAEVKKSALLCNYYIENGIRFLKQDSIIETDHKSVIRYDPIGAVFGIMPWNFPLWQVMRYAIPSLIAGNVVFLKPAPNVPATSLMIEQLFSSSGAVPDIFQTLFIEIDQVETVICHPLIQGVTLTGSDKAGASAAAIAGSQIKKVVLELGGSDAFIVLSDANLKEAATAYIASKFNNAGQTCIAAKRLLLAREIEEPFLLLIAELIDQLVIGDPLSHSTDLGCMARPDLVDKLESQVQKSISMGAEVILQGGRIGQTNFFHPMLVSHVLPGMPLFEEEVFGPVGVICLFDSIKEAVELANLSKYGLGCSIWSEDLMKAKDIAGKINAGSIHINQMVVSDPRVPFGGVKRSGFGRELGLNGIKEFVNIKTVTVA